MKDLQQPDSGWQLVPQKLTAKMAGLLQWCERGSPDQLQEAWRQLLDAAPQPAQEPVAWPSGSAQLHTSLLDMGKAMAKERSREIGDAWNQLADLLYLLSKARNTPQAPQPAQEPVAVIGSDYQLLWVRRDWSEGLNVGDFLYTTPQAPQPSPIKLSSDGAAAVNPDTFWIPITKENMPIEGARMLLINRATGIAMVSTFKNDGWYTHFAGLPKFKD